MTFIGNYTADPAQLWVAEDGRRVPDVFARSFATEWGRQAELAAGQVIDAGAELVLVLPPPMISPRVQVVTDRLRAEYQRVAAHWPGQVTLVDAAVALGGPGGGWVAARRTPAGRLAPVRTADTVHLAPFGQQLEARAVRQALATLEG
jgi:hypothetical protein